VSTAVVAGGNATPILQFTEHIFDFVASLVQIYVVGQLDFTVAQRGNARLHTPLSQFFPKPVGITSFVSQ
jgi:hypothetical protein